MFNFFKKPKNRYEIIIDRLQPIIDCNLSYNEPKDEIIFFKGNSHSSTPTNPYTILDIFFDEINKENYFICVGLYEIEYVIKGLEKIKYKNQLREKKLNRIINETQDI